MRANRGLRLCQRRRDIGCASVGRDVPGEGEQIAPMAFGGKKRGELRLITRAKRRFKAL